MAEWIETYRGAVHAWQEDHNGHMNVTHYVAKFDEGTWPFLAMPCELSARKPRYVHRMIDAETAEEIAEMELIGVHTDRKTRRARPFPDEIRANGARLLGEAA